MRRIILTAILASLALPLSPALAQYDQGRHDQNQNQQDQQDRQDRHDQRDQQNREDQRDQMRGHEHSDQAESSYDQWSNRRANQQNRWYDRRAHRWHYAPVYSAYNYNHPDPRYGTYEADRYYVRNNRYQQREMRADERVYRGRDDRLYCRRSDGTTGLIVGGIAGGALGNSIARGGSRTLGTLLGVGLGAAIGGQIDHGHTVCR